MQILSGVPVSLSISKTSILNLCLESAFDSSSLYTDNVHRDLVSSPGNRILLHFPEAGAEILWSVLKR